MTGSKPTGWGAVLPEASLGALTGEGVLTRLGILMRWGTALLLVSVGALDLVASASAATGIVSNTNNSGPGSLRRVIEAAV